MPALWRLSATDLSGRIRGLEVSALARLDALNLCINAAMASQPTQTLAGGARTSCIDPI